MIYRFYKVTNNLYRGSAPSPKDVQLLHNKLGIKKIVSLDALAAKRIDRICKLLHINHVIIPLTFDNFISSLKNFIKHDLKKLLLDGGPTFVHCEAGKDRTGLAVAMVQCKYLGKNPKEAIDEAVSLGFGIGIPKIITIIYKRLIKSCVTNDENNADIVSNVREYIGDNRDSFLDQSHQGSFSPYLDATRQYPYDSVYNFIVDQFPTRENYNSSKSVKENNDEKNLPLVGIYNNDAGVRGFGPTENAGGFIYD